MIKKVIFLAIISLFLFFAFSGLALAAKSCTGDNDCPPGMKCRPDPYDQSGAKKICARPLEIIYPPVPGGGAVPDTTATGLPQYIKYIFQWAVVVIGFIIFAVMVYSGVKYLTSIGDPAKMVDAREGIFMAFLGGIILLSAFIIFNSINPQLTILKLPEVGSLEGLVTPGVYICSYVVPNIDDVLKRYLEKEGDDQVEAVKELRAIMADPSNKAKSCPMAVFSGNLQNFTVKKDGNTIFIVPALSYEYNDATGKYERRWKYGHGIVLHEKDDFRGKCKYYPKEDSNNLLFSAQYEDHQISGKKAEGLGFEARSFTVFKKPIQEPGPGAEGIVLYSCLDYNRTGMCPGLKDGVGKFPTGGNSDILKLPQEGNLKGLGDKSLANETRSVQISPRGSYFALLHEDENFGGKCEAIKSNDPNLTDQPIGRCGAGCTTWGKVGGWFLTVMPIIGSLFTPDCLPCTSSMIVIKGEAL